MLPVQYKFLDFVIDVRQETLCKNGETLNVKSRAFQVLQFLLENAGNVVTKEEFFERIWQGAFVEDNNLTVAVAQIRKALGETNENKFIETVTKKGYRFVAGVERVFDENKAVQTEGELEENALTSREKILANLKTNKKNPTEQPTKNTKQTVFAQIFSHKVLSIIAFALIIFLIAAFWQSSVAPTKVEPFRSIAVLPFSTANSSPDNQIFAERLTGDLTQNLGRITNVRVAAYEAAAPFDENVADLTKIETELKIDGTVSGEIKTNGTTTDINIKINDLRSGRQLWEKHYSANAPDLPESQYRIARDIAREIGQNDLPLNALATANFEAYQAYLAGRYFLGRGSSKDLEKAVENFTAATVKDSSFADSHSGLAVAYIVQGLDLYASEGLNASRQSFPAAGERAKRALELDPHSDEALAALAFVNYRYEYDWKNAEQNFKRAIELKSLFKFSRSQLFEHNSDHCQLNKCL